MAVTPRARLRTLLHGDRAAIIGGAHDVLRARLVEEAGYDGVWAGSFAMSLASRCLPDADLLSMNESLTIVRNMVQSLVSPLIADCSAGFGNALNVMQMVREFEAAGVAGVCIEDNDFPKRSSLYESWPQMLVSREEMVGKIRGAKDAQTDPTSSSSRASSRWSSGSRWRWRCAGPRPTRRPEPTRSSCTRARSRRCASSWRAWSGSVRLVAVPTLYPEVGLAELEGWGIQVAIYPNQSIRAAIRAMQATLSAIREAGSALPVDDSIVPLSEVDRIVRLDALRTAGRRDRAVPQMLAT